MKSDNEPLIPIIKDLIVKASNGNGEIVLSYLVDGVAKKFIFDTPKEKEKSMARFCRQIIAQFRDENGDRTIFATGKTGEFINIETCQDAIKLDLVLADIERKMNGLARSAAKIKYQIEGQISFDDIMEAQP